jgi:hypothetical protein
MLNNVKLYNSYYDLSLNNTNIEIHILGQFHANKLVFLVHFLCAPLHSFHTPRLQYSKEMDLHMEMGGNARGIWNERHNVRPMVHAVLSG